MTKSEAKKLAINEANSYRNFVLARVHKCPIHKCKNWVFTLGNGRYCSMNCANEAQKEEKLRWWNRVGKFNRQKSRESAHYVLAGNKV